MRWIGGLLLLLGGVGAGILPVLRLSRQERQLSRWIFLLERMAGELENRETDTLTLLREMERDEYGDLFRRCARQMEAGECLSACWAQCFGEMDWALDESQQTLLLRCGEILGRYDGRTQGRLLRSLASELRLRLPEVRRYRREGSRVWPLTAGSVALLVLLAAGG